MTLTLSEAVGAGDSITVTYARPDSPPKLEGRNNQDAESFNAYAVDNVTIAPAPAPAMSMATVAADGASMTLTFSVPLDQSDEGLPELTAFSLSGTEATIESLSIFDSTVALVLNPGYRCWRDRTSELCRAERRDQATAQIGDASNTSGPNLGRVCRK